jgi:DNA modification methylase
MLRAERIPVDSLRAHPRNPRKITPARLAALERVLAADPQMLEARPLIALADGTLIAGNQRWRAARALRDAGDDRFETVPTIHVDLEPERATEWALRDNEGFGVRDDQITAELLQELADAGRNLELTGMTEHDLQKLLDPRAAAGDAETVPPAPRTAKSEAGAVYQLGPHLVMCGDATSSDDVTFLLAEQKADIVWTDPPYGVDYVGKTAEALTLAGDRLQEPALKHLVRNALQLAHRNSRAGAPIYVAHPDSASVMFREALDEAGWSLRQVLVWVKQQFVLGRQDYNWQHEPILYGWKGGAAHTWLGMFDQTTVVDDETDLRSLDKPALVRIIRELQNERRTTVVREDRPHASADHPTTKPVALVQRQLVNSSIPGSVVYDPFGGSGSTLLAAERTGRRARLMEIDPVYVDVVRQRFADYTDQPELAP